MIIAAKSFLFPSVAAHLLAIALVLIVMWSAPTFKTASVTDVAADRFTYTRSPVWL